MVFLVFYPWQPSTDDHYNRARDFFTMEVCTLKGSKIPKSLIEVRLSGNGLVSYYINLVLEGVGISDTGTKAAINGGLQVWNLLAAMTGALLVDRLGRRTLFIISNVGMLIGRERIILIVSVVF